MGFYNDNGGGSTSGSTLYISSGTVVKPTITYNNGGTVAVGTGTYRLYHTDDFTGIITEHTISGIILTLPDGLVARDIVADYNNGTPILRMAIEDEVNESNIMGIYTVSRSGDIFSSIDWGTEGIGLVNKLNNASIDSGFIKRQSGLDMGELATRTVVCGGGTIQCGTNPVDLPSFTSTTDECYLLVKNASGWNTPQSITQYPNTKYDNSTGTLANLTAGQYGVIWVYRSGGAPSQKRIYLVLGRQAYDLNGAKTSQPVPDIPEALSTNTILLGRIIVLYNATSATQIDSAFVYSFSPSTVTNHEGLTSLEGGNVSHHYHSDQPINKTDAVEFKSLNLTGMTKAQRLALTPVEGLEVYQTDEGLGKYIYSGGIWQKISNLAVAHFNRPWDGSLFIPGIGTGLVAYPLNVAQQKILSGITFSDAGDSLTISSAGIYRITFVESGVSGSGNYANEAQILVNGVVVAVSTGGNTTGLRTNVMTEYVNTLSAGNVITFKIQGVGVTSDIMGGSVTVLQIS